MPVAGPARASWTGRSASTLERSRWVFGLLTLATTVFVAPHMLESAGRLELWTGAGLLLMATSWVISYRRQRVTLLNDLIEAPALNFVIASLDEPAVTFGFVFPMIWFRSLYGSTAEVVFRTLLYEIVFVFQGMVSAELGRPDDPHQMTFMLGGVMGIIACSVAGRRVVSEGAARDLSAARDRLVAERGTQLLGLTDAAAIRQIRWLTLAEIGRSAPELRIVNIDLSGDELRIDRTVGSFASVPARIAWSDLGLGPSDSLDSGGRGSDGLGSGGLGSGGRGSGGLGSDGLGDGTIGPMAVPVLDRAVARTCSWVVLSFRNTYVLVGHPGRLEPDLLASVRSVCNQSALAFQNSRVHSQLSVQARTDALTGLANRQGFAEAVQHLAVDRVEKPLAVLFIDLDDFKEVNDTLGHKAGDELLDEVAGLLRSVTRAGQDVVARLGGDEFAILLHNTSQENAQQVAERIVLGVSVLEVANGLSVGASIGVAMASSRMDFDELLVHADVAMYAAKADGKGRIQAYYPGLVPRNP